ncbi:MAG: GGDEF domain-containing protein [Chloroflexi bacterium]|nr:GGDEF domain-containing protein [Chloroflexota bacterium]
MTTCAPGQWEQTEQPTLGRWLVVARFVGTSVWCLGLAALIAEQATGSRSWHIATFAIYLAILPLAAALSTILRRRQQDLDLRWAHHLHELAMRDDLTGLFNRRYFNAELDRLAAECARAGMPLSLAFVDLNDFKAINDAHGHEAGDAALQGVAHCLVDLVGDNGIVARTGGDEFGVLLPGMSEAAAQVLFGPACKTLPVAVAGKSFGIDGTVGIATLDVTAGVRQLLRRADDHLYEMKRARARGDRAA